MRLTLSLLALLAFAMPAVAQEPAPTSAAEATANLDGLLSTLKTTYEDVSTLQANFTQVTSSPAFGEGPSQDGSITIARPRQMHVSFTGDNTSQFISNGETLWVYSPDNNQVIVTPNLSEQSDGLSDLIQSLGALQERFEVTALPAPEGMHAVSLAPRDGAQFKSLKLVLDSQYHLVSLEIVDATDSTTTMNFRDVQMNPTIDTNLFNFEAPEGATVIRTDEI